MSLGMGRPVELAGRGARLGARIIDWVIMLIALPILSIVIAWMGVDAVAAPAVVVALLSAVLGYEVVLTATKGQTLGKMAARVKVVRADDGHVPGWRKSFGRWAVINLIPFLGLLAYVSLTWDPKRQGWHDKAVSTFVVKV